MSTFMGHACLDLVAGASVREVLDALADRPDGDPPEVHISELPDGGHRVILFADWGNVWLEEFLESVAERVGARLSRVLLALNYDEYGVEHVVFAVHSGGLRCVHRVHVRPEGQQVPEPPQLAELAGVGARRRAAELFGVPVANMEHAARLNERAHEHLCTVFTPHAHWWDALGVEWPDPGSELWTKLGGP